MTQTERVAAALERLERRQRLYPTGDKEIPEYVKGHDSFCSDAATLAKDYPRLAADNATLREQVKLLREACEAAHDWFESFEQDTAADEMCVAALEATKETT